MALHGLSHRRAFLLDRSAWRDSLRDGKALLEDLTGTPVVGYRAPEWSLRGPAADWWQDLPELGFRYDASRAPLAVIGDIAWPRRPYLLTEGLWELPPPVLWRGPLTSPLWGWGPRVLPFSLVRRALEALALEDAGTPLVLHPWELDEAQPDLPGASLGHRFAHSAGLRGYGDRLRELLAGFELVSLEPGWPLDEGAAPHPAGTLRGQSPGGRAWPSAGDAGPGLGARGPGGAGPEWLAC